MPTKPPPATKYQLGQCVTFQWVVGQRANAQGKPVRQKLTKLRTGTVIAMRKVYDRVPGSVPPVLTNPRDVYLVATSLHRHYRVYENDLSKA